VTTEVRTFDDPAKCGRPNDGAWSPTHRWKRVGLPSLIAKQRLSGFPSGEPESVSLETGPGDLMSSRPLRDFRI